MPIHVLKYTLPLLFLLGCKQKTEGEYIYRRSDDHLFVAERSEPLARPPYPWEQSDSCPFPRITKEFFRCHGNPHSPVREKKREGRESFYFYDCDAAHSLPIQDGEEFVYPILLDLLNYVQKELNQKVTITTGHRCPTHNSYSDYTPYNYGSKHMIGAEVDFYVENVSPLKVIDCLQTFYDKPFARYTKGNLNVKTEGWYNDEVFIKLYLPCEGRDIDNQHNHPYISIQVRFDRDRKEAVRFDKAKSERLLSRP